MRNGMIHLLILGAVVTIAAGETVFLRDGRKFSGEVSREGGKVHIKMAIGTIVVDEKDVQNLEELGLDGPSETTDPDRPATTGTPSVVWNESQVVLPQPILFMTGRRLELLRGKTDIETLSQQVQQWRAIVHDGKRKVGLDWIGRDQQIRRREEFVKQIKEADSSARKVRYMTPRTPAEKAEKARQEEEAKQAFYTAVKRWPDMQIRDFLTGVLDLQYDNAPLAERRFRLLIDQNPLVAAFHQGRGLALSAMQQPVRAMEEYTVCLVLRDDNQQTIKLVQDGLKEVAGKDLEHPTCVRARELADRYDKPRYAYRSTSSGVPWLMPGKEWQTRSDDLPVPPYDRVIARQALAVPVTAAGALLVDAAAVADADAVYVQIGPDRVVPAQPSGRTIYTSRGGADIPLTTIFTRGVTFAPVEVDKPAELKADDRVTVRAVNLYRVMGTEIRAGEATVVAADEGGKPALDRPLLPGEPVGVVEIGGRFAGFLTPRTDVVDKDFGDSRLIPPADFAEWFERQKRSLEGTSSYRWRSGPALKKDAEPIKAEGSVFLVHILQGEKPPTKLGK